MRHLMFFIIILLFVRCSNEKIVYVDNGKLFNSFILKKKLQVELEKSISSQKAQLDSLEVELKILAAKMNEHTARIEIENFEQKRRVFKIYSDRFEEEKNKQIKSMDFQIWNQLNTYVAEYGKENNLDIIIASSGDGNVMYVNEKNNITDKVVQYVNNKYKGK
jgi:outer membrane protein